jgi:anti-sigma regulatory factor (Ser/Thr protein kinase)
MKNDLEDFSRVLGDVYLWMERHSVPEASQLTVSLAFEELVRNVMRHSYGESDRSREIGVELLDDRASVLLTIQDDGPPFDPTSAPRVDTAAPIEDREEGGLGIHLVLTMASDVRYERRDDTNVVSVRVSR